MRKPRKPRHPHHPKAAKAAKATKATHHVAHHKAHHAHKATSHPGSVKRSLALGDWAPVCAFEALAASLRAAGRPVSDDDVLRLWLLSGGDEQGATIEAALDAAARFGLAGFRPVALGADLGVSINPLDPAGQLLPQFGHRLHAHALILGVSLPGPHAVLATADGWHSWGGLYDPWTDDIDEAWVVAWH